MHRVKILLVEDEPLQRSLVVSMLHKIGPKMVEEAADGLSALKMLGINLENLNHSYSSDYDLVILDINLPDINGLEVLKAIKKGLNDIPVIMLTANESLEDAITCMKAGADDFITKPTTMDRLSASLSSALKLRLLGSEVARLRRKNANIFSFSDIIGHDGALKDEVTIARKASQSDLPVLITGESGVGKELFARAIHGESKRADGPMISVNCGAIPENLVESTLFGHEKGAFTGAVAKQTGKFQEADGGTLFLDEVGELPLETQVKLLRAIQQKEIQPVGSTRTSTVDIRIVAATNRLLPEMIKKGLFREDLYYRINVLEIMIKPLRERKKDIEALAQYFITRWANMELRPPATLSPDTVKAMMQYPWPGNVREMENTLMRALVLQENHDALTLALGTAENQTSAPTSSAQHTTESGLSIQLEHSNNHLKTMAEIELEIIELLQKNKEMKVGAIASALGISQATLYRRIAEKSAK